MWRILGTALVCLLVVGMASPFIRDAWAWYHIHSTYAMDDTEKADYARWSGSPDSFVDLLRGRCVEMHRDTPENCARYRAI
jgi:hypothetical protein